MKDMSSLREEEEEEEDTVANLYICTKAKQKKNEHPKTNRR